MDICSIAHVFLLSLLALAYPIYLFSEATLRSYWTGATAGEETEQGSISSDPFDHSTVTREVGDAAGASEVPPERDQEWEAASPKMELPHFNTFDDPANLSLISGGSQTPSILCKVCRAIRKDYGSVHHTPENLIKSARIGCPCCRMIVNEIRNKELTTQRCSQIELGTKSDIIYKIFAYPDRFNNLFLRFELVRHRDLDETFPPKLDKVFRRKIPPDPASDESYGLISKWVETCLRNHIDCQQTSTTLPTRVIDVSREDPRLVESKACSAPYVALSHCWGFKKTLTTTIATIQDRYQKIDLCVFPLTFKDAVSITRRLGVQYLWIDSICIIQDSNEDWDSESRQMKDYYRNSYITISALQSPNSHYGIFACPDPVTHIKLSSEPNLYLRPSLPDHSQLFQKAVLNHRAWALQERLLSTRVIHYSDKEIFWECFSCTTRQGSAMESTERLDPSSIITSEGEDFKRILAYLKPQISKERSEIPLIWYRLVTQYSRRQLTMPNDRLPAISGLASAIYDATRHTYLAGIWREDLNDLLWFLDSKSYHAESIPKALFRRVDSSRFASLLKRKVGLTRTVQLSEEQQHQRLSGLSAEDYGYQAPSWSWASIPRPVYYRGRGDETQIIDVSRDMKIIDADTTITGTDPFGRVYFGYLHVRAYTLPLVSIEVLGTDLPKLNHDADTVDLYIPTGSVSASLIEEREESVQDRQVYFGCAFLDDTIRRLFGHGVADTGIINCSALWAVEKCSSVDKRILYCLLLQKIHPDSELWRRIGIARVSSTPDDGDYRTDWIWEGQELTII